MNSIDIRTEKANAIFRYRSFQNITTLLFRFIEICIFLIIISTFSSQLPFCVRVSTDQLSRLFSFISINTRSVFVIGNIIILTLLYKSRVADNTDPYVKIDFYDEYVRRYEKSAGNSRHRKMTSSVTEKPSPEICRSQSEKAMSVENNDGQCYRRVTSSVTERKLLKNVESPEICRSQPEKEGYRNVTSSVNERKVLKNFDCCGGEKQSPEICASRRKMTSSVAGDCCGGEKVWPEICRSKSEKMMRVECRDGQSQRKLRRSVTERGMGKNVECCGGVDELSSEAFRRTVEAFIERQQRCLRDEELAPVPYVGA